MEMIDILQKFIKAERTEPWELHLQAVYEMIHLPYFAASGHNLYVKSAYLYLQLMQDVKKHSADMWKKFEDGFHAVCRSDHYWAGVSSGLVIDQVLMRIVKTSGGLTQSHGVHHLVWLLSMPAYADVNIHQL